MHTIHIILTKWLNWMILKLYQSKSAEIWQFTCWITTLTQICAWLKNHPLLHFPFTKYNCIWNDLILYWNVSFLGWKILQSIPIGPLSICVDVHFDNSIFDSSLDFFLSWARTTVHYQKCWFGIGTAQLLLNIFLMSSLWWTIHLKDGGLICIQ